MTDCIYFKKKKKKFLKTTGQLDPTRNPTQPATRLTRLKMTRFDPQPDRPDPNPTRPARFAMSTCTAHKISASAIVFIGLKHESHIV